MGAGDVEVAVFVPQVGGDVAKVLSPVEDNEPNVVSRFQGANDAFNRKPHADVVDSGQEQSVTTMAGVFSANAPDEFIFADALVKNSLADGDGVDGTTSAMAFSS